MERRRIDPALRAVCLASVALCLLAARMAGAAGASEILARQAPALRARLEDAKVVILDAEEGDAAEGWVKALAIFERPREEVMRLVAQSTRQIEYRPEITAIETVERFPNGTVDEHAVKILFIALHYRLRAQIDYAAGRAWWGLDPRFANDLSRFDGYWEFHELGPARTLGVFGTVVDIGPAFPRMLQDSVTRKNVPQTVDRTRRWVDSGGAWRP